METIRFKSRLFGFKRRQVLEYIDASFASYEQQLADCTRAHQTYREQAEEKIALQQNALDQSVKETNQLQEQLDEISQTLENTNHLLSNREHELASLQQELQQSRLLASGLHSQLDLLQQQKNRSDAKLEEKDRLIAKQALEVTRLHDSVDSLEEHFRSVQADAEQGTAMVNLLNLLHGRNRALTKQVARLQAQLENERSDSQVESFVKAAAQKQEAVKTTEQLFATVRREIQEALDSISDKIEHSSLTPEEDHSFVDLANL